ncbi:MAG: methyltransferase domain-containing protein [Deltaproteobacteria bacterium]|jgi:SAM-dependent methyltransferase|nr:methyltransferase domain-containing protein [Deltaproteobacteria bacterium]
MEIAEKLLKNWTDSSSRYSNLILAELDSFRRQAWIDLIMENAGVGPPAKVLDVGTGPGFFSIILTQAGYRVTGVDCTQAMIDQASVNAANLGLSIDLRLSDSQDLDYPEATFDLIVNRNVAWTLVDAAKAYREWHRILRPGGRALIFDANWNLNLFEPALQQAIDADLVEYATRFPDLELPSHSDEALDFRRGMPQCRRRRPQWDFGALLEAGFAKIYCDTTISQRIYDEAERLLYRSRPMFLLAAEKKA